MMAGSSSAGEGPHAMTSKMPRSANVAALSLLTLHAVLLGWAATKHSPTIDEAGHIAAGVSHWSLGRFDLYHVNPPLVRLVAALPVALCRPLTDWEGYLRVPGARSEHECGTRFINLNGERSFWFFTLARWACIPFSVLGGFVCYRWAGELYGAPGGLLALAAWCFSPNVLAHGQLITPDLGGAAAGAAAWYLFWRWLRAPSWPRAFAAGAVMGLAELTKSTFIIFYALAPLAWIAWRVAQAWRRGAGTSEKGAARQLAMLALMAALSVYTINLGYAFEDCLRPLGDFTFLSQALAGAPDPEAYAPPPVNRFRGTALARFPVPLPANYILGIDQQKTDFEHGMQSYLRGEWRDHGWWYYYLYGLAVKVPLGTWALIFLAVCSRWARPASDRAGRANWLDEFTLLLPAVVILVFVSSQTGFSSHLRYVLPIFPYVFIWTGRLGVCFDRGAASLPSAARQRRSRVLAALAVLALAWSVVSSLRCYPHSLSYFNECAGGPLGGRRHLVDSNLDWGQDLLYLKSWLDDHPEARPLGLAYFGVFDPRVAGIDFSLPPFGPARLGRDSRAASSAPRPPAPNKESGPLPGWYAVSVMLLEGGHWGIPDGNGGTYMVAAPYFNYFQYFEPVATAGYSIYIYHLEPAEVGRVRRKLGLRALDGD